METASTPQQVYVSSAAGGGLLYVCSIFKVRVQYQLEGPPAQHNMLLGTPPPPYYYHNYMLPLEVGSLTVSTLFFSIDTSSAATQWNRVGNMRLANHTLCLLFCSATWPMSTAAFVLPLCCRAENRWQKSCFNCIVCFYVAIQTCYERGNKEELEHYGTPSPAPAPTGSQQQQQDALACLLLVTSGDYLDYLGK